MAEEAVAAWKKTLKDAGLPDTLVEKLVAEGYDGEEAFLSSVPDENACGAVLIVVKAEGITADTASVHPWAGKLRLVHRKLAKAKGSLEDESKASRPAAAEGVDPRKQGQCT